MRPIKIFLLPALLLGHQAGTVCCRAADTISISFTPGYAPKETSVSVSFTPSYMPAIGDVAISFSPDYNPPASISDLSIGQISSYSITLKWTAPGDNGLVGDLINGRYQIRYSESLTNGQVSGLSIGLATTTIAGNSESYMVNDSFVATTYYFQIRAGDDAGNWSDWSNIAQTLTVYDSTDSFVSLIYRTATLLGQTTAPYIVIEPTTTSRAVVVLSSAAQAGNLIIGNLYDIAPDSTVFAPPATLIFRYQEPLPSGVLESDLNVHKYDPGTGWQILPALEHNLFENWIKVEISSLCFYAILATDRTSPVVVLLSPHGGGRYSGTTPIRIDYSVVDNLDITPTSYAYFTYLADGSTKQVLTGSEISPLELKPGFWTMTVEAVDDSLNHSSATTGAFEIIHDSLPPRTALAIGEPRFGVEPVYISSVTHLVFVQQDDVAEVGDNLGHVDKTYYSTDGGAFRVFPMNVSSFTIVEEGLHSLDYYSTDVAGNIETVKTSSIAVDTTAPDTDILIGEPKFNLNDGGILISSSTPMRLSAVDPTRNSVRSGIGASLYAIGSSENFAVYDTPFVLPALDGAKIVRYYSRDNVANQEIIKTTSVLLDQTPPVSLINSPSPESRGLDKVFNRSLAVNITVSDEHLGYYKLEMAKGENAERGFELLYESTVPVSQRDIYLLNAKNYAEAYYTLKLTAIDHVNNTSVLMSTVYLGEPHAELLVNTSGKPEGVAVDDSGNIYVSDTEKDGVYKLNQNGEFVAIFTGSSQGDKKGLEEPLGMAIDESGNIYVADRNNHRVLVMSRSGEVINIIGNRNTQGKPIPGKEHAHLHSPMGVAVSNDRIVVADKDGIKVFDRSANYLFAIWGKDVSGKQVEDNARYFDVAIDKQSYIYASESNNGGIRIFDRDGIHVNNIGDNLKESRGIDVTEYVYSADNKRGKILKYTYDGKLALEFSIKHPYALVVDNQRNLYVTDREKGELRKFVLSPKSKLKNISMAAGKQDGTRVESENIKRDKDNIYVEAEPGDVVTIEVHGPDGTRIASRQFTVPIGVAGIFNYTYAPAEKVLALPEYRCNVEILYQGGMQRAKEEIKNCKSIGVRFIKQ